MERMKAQRRFNSSQKQYFLPGAGFLIRTKQLSSSAVFCNATTLPLVRGITEGRWVVQQISVTQQPCP